MMAELVAFWRMTIRECWGMEEKAVEAGGDQELRDQGARWILYMNANVFSN